jgi:hypothetical protein
MKKIIAYITVTYRYFNEIIPELSRSFEIIPLYLFKTLKKLGNNPTPDNFAIFLENFINENPCDALWSYNKPDEITTAICCKRNIPIFVQEYYGHCPYNIDAIMPFNLDCLKLSSNNNQKDKNILHEHPLITFILSPGIFSDNNNISAVFKNWSGKEDNHPFWFKNNLLEDYSSLMKLTIDLYKSLPELKDCRLVIRPHPKYKEKFQQEINYIENLHDKDIILDYSPTTDSLNKTDIVICVASNYGFDGIRNGCEVITFGNKAFYNNPQLTLSPCTPEELIMSLTTTVNKIKINGKKIKPFVPQLIKELKGPLASICESPFNVEKTKNAMIHGLSLPILHNF